MIGERELTPALVRGAHGSVTPVPGETRPRAGAPGRGGELLHHLFDDGGARRESTVFVAAVPQITPFAPAIVCRDRNELGGGPAQLPAERWVATRLESPEFNRRYRLLTLAGQDPIFVRELFSPALIAWLADEVPPGFSFELNDGYLAAFLPGHLEADEAARLRELGAELERRLLEEALEETGNLFDEAARSAALEAGLARLLFERPPPSALYAAERFRALASNRPFVLARAALWAAGALLLLAVPVGLVFNPVIGVIAGLVLAIPTFLLVRLMSAARYRWGEASVNRLGLEAFVRGYAESHGLALADRVRFHADHRTLPLPGTADYVLAGADAYPLFLVLGDDAELRSQGTETVWSERRPLAALALVADLGTPERVEELVRGARPEGLELETSGTVVALWRSYRGNLLFDSEQFDDFRAEAGAALGLPVNPLH